MHRPIHEIIAAIGGILFIVVGVARQRERIRLIHAGRKAEGPLTWNLLIIVGICLLIFASGVMIYEANHAQA